MGPPAQHNRNHVPRARPAIVSYGTIAASRDTSGVVAVRLPCGHRERRAVDRVHHVHLAALGGRVHCPEHVAGSPSSSKIAA